MGVKTAPHVVCVVTTPLERARKQTRPGGPLKQRHEDPPGRQHRSLHEALAGTVAFKSPRAILSPSPSADEQMRTCGLSTQWNITRPRKRI